MGWFGTLVVGAVVGIAGTWRDGRHPRWLAALICGLAAMVIKMIGNIAGLFDDGSMLEWVVSVGAAILAVAVLPRLPTLRSGGSPRTSKRAR